MNLYLNHQNEYEDEDEDENENQDLISVSSYNSDDENHDITWYIDHSGDYNLLNQISKNKQNQNNLNFVVDISNKNNNSKIECNICYDEHEYDEFIKLSCNHEFCYICTFKQINSNNYDCAFCRNKIYDIIVRKEEIKTDYYKSKK